MTEINKEGKKPETVTISSELLKKLAELKEKSAKLKQKMEITHKACEELLHHEKKPTEIPKV